MIVKVGDKVRLLHTKKVGFVKDYINDQMIRIDVDGDDIPVFLDDLEFMDDEVVIPPKRVSYSREIKNPTSDDESRKGFFVAFVPIRDKSNTIQEFQVYLINNFEESLLLSYDFKLRGRDVYRVKKELLVRHFYPLNKFEFDKLNDLPSLNFDVWLKNKRAGKQQHFNKLIKIKPQIFFKNYTDIPLMDMEGFVYLVFDEPPAIEAPKIEKKELPELNIKHIHIKKGNPVKLNEILRKAEMQHEIDLHIEKLVPNHKNLSNREIVKIQLDQCRRFIDQAIINNLHQIYLIHGLGKGKLKSEINKILDEYDEVKSYNNNFHPRYGYGATEVIL